MLISNIYYQSFEGEIENIFRAMGLKKKAQNHYTIFGKNEKKVAELTFKPEENKLHITFSGNLSFIEYEMIHNTIVHITELCNGVIDDSEALIGYLENGEKVYIVKNWDEWSLFIHEAKYKTLEGQKVKVTNEKEVELGSGLLVDYTLETSKSHSYLIKECTLITSFGERKFIGELLTIEPTDRW